MALAGSRIIYMAGPPPDHGGQRGVGGGTGLPTKRPPCHIRRSGGPGWSRRGHGIRAVPGTDAFCFFSPNAIAVLRTAR